MQKQIFWLLELLNLNEREEKELKRKERKNGGV